MQNGNNAIDLPWRGMPNVRATLERLKDGVLVGKLVIQLPQGGDPIVIVARANERQIRDAILQRSSSTLQQSASSGALGGFLKRVAGVAKNVARGKVVQHLSQGFSNVMRQPIAQQAMQNVMPQAAKTFAALKGAQALGFNPLQVARMQRLPPAQQAQLAQIIKKRAGIVQQLRWNRAKQRAAGVSPDTLRRAYLAGRAACAPGGASAGDAAVADLRAAKNGEVPDSVAKAATQMGKSLLTRSRQGDKRAQFTIRCIYQRAKNGEPNAVRGARILLACARELNGGAASGYYEIGAMDPQAPMSLANYYTIGGSSIPFEIFYGSASAGWGHAYDPIAQTAGVHMPNIAQTAGRGYGNAGPVYDIAGCSSGCGPGAAAGAYYGPAQAYVVTGDDGRQYQQAWNGIRWVWQELRPHVGLRGEGAGFGMRDAMLLGMQKMQQRELAS